MTHAPNDPQLETLLDEALAPPRHDPALADRIIAATRPRLGAPPLSLATSQRPVIGRIGGAGRTRPASPLAPLAGLAAAVAVALGLATWAVQGPAPAAPEALGGAAGAEGAVATRVTPVSALALADARLHALADADTAWGTDVDRQLTVLSLQVDVAAADDFWTNPQRAVEDAVLHQQLDALAGDPFTALF